MHELEIKYTNRLDEIAKIIAEKQRVALIVDHEYLWEREKETDSLKARLKLFSKSKEDLTKIKISEALELSVIPKSGINFEKDCIDNGLIKNVYKIEGTVKMESILEPNLYIELHSEDKTLEVEYRKLLNLEKKRYVLERRIELINILLKE